MNRSTTENKSIQLIEAFGTFYKTETWNIQRDVGDSMWNQVYTNQKLNLQVSRAYNAILLPLKRVTDVNTNIVLWEAVEGQHHATFH